MKEKTVVFRYRKGNSIIHRLPALIKLFALISLAVNIMFLPLYAVCVGIILLVIPAFLCGFSVREQFTDIKPALFYAFFLYLISIFTNLSSTGFTIVSSTAFIKILLPNDEYALYILRLLLVMQLSALLFRTTTSIEIKEVICSVEIAIRGVLRKLPFARNISLTAKFGTSAALTINFIPALFELWDKLNRAYRARGGKGGLKQFRVLLVALIALSFHYAERKARALLARELV
ncbi:MAG: energy-coupling factor transporter transmembrane protein EcfT [Treponema sp.]|jgi:biotin transport system permease protein/energy-coupling factor transport system permease protein|nr:energy-coupling factor transporter transmembrane protein EcfT [Treponema sp.]